VGDADDEMTAAWAQVALGFGACIHGEWPSLRTAWPLQARYGSYGMEPEAENQATKVVGSGGA